MSIKLEGPWQKGLAYDVHTLESTYLVTNESGRDRWENKRTVMGELVYQLKYRGEKRNVKKIIDLITARIKGLESFDAIVPIPPSKNRNFQPVIEIAKELGKRKRVRVLEILYKTGTDKELKNIDETEERKSTLKKTMKLSDGADISGKKILLFDDLYRSGATLEVAANLLLKKGKAELVSVLVLTKTRSNR